MANIAVSFTPEGTPRFTCSCPSQGPWKGPNLCEKCSKRVTLGLQLAVYTIPETHTETSQKGDTRYNYQCKDCGHVFSAEQSIDAMSHCPLCGSDDFNPSFHEVDITDTQLDDLVERKENGHA